MQIYKCPYCMYQKDSWSVKRHISRKHVASQAGHGVQQGEQIIPNHVQQIISQQQKQNFNYYIRQWTSNLTKWIWKFETGSKWNEQVHQWSRFSNCQSSKWYPSLGTC